MEVACASGNKSQRCVQKRSGGASDEIAGRWQPMRVMLRRRSPLTGAVSWWRTCMVFCEKREKWVPSTVGPGIQQTQPAVSSGSRAGGVEAEMNAREEGTVTIDDD